MGEWEKGVRSGSWGEEVVKEEEVVEGEVEKEVLKEAVWGGQKEERVGKWELRRNWGRDGSRRLLGKDRKND